MNFIFVIAKVAIKKNSKVSLTTVVASNEIRTIKIVCISKLNWRIELKEMDHFVEKRVTTGNSFLLFVLKRFLNLVIKANISL